MNLRGHGGSIPAYQHVLVSCNIAAALGTRLRRVPLGEARPPTLRAFYGVMAEFLGVLARRTRRGTGDDVRYCLTVFADHRVHVSREAAVLAVGRLEFVVAPGAVKLVYSPIAPSLALQPVQRHAAAVERLLRDTCEVIVMGEEDDLRAMGEVV
jgi:hypothetical protein